MNYRNMIHIMLGNAFEGIVQNLMGYVLSYEDKDLSDFFTGMLCTREENGSLVFKTTRRVAPENDGQKKFNPEPEDPFKVELVEDTTIEEKDQLAHLKNYFSRLFDKRVTINSKSRVPVLNICIYFQMYDEGVWSLAKLLVEAISEQSRNINVDLFMLSSDLAYLFIPDDKQAELPTEIVKYQRLEKGILNEAVNFKKDAYVNDASKLGHILVMQNCNETGLSLDFNCDSFVRVIGEFAIATMNSYNDIFQPNAEIEGRPIHSFGLCVLNLDKYFYVKYLLSKAYVTILEREGINQDYIDVNGPSQLVQNALLGDDKRQYKFFDNFYDHRVKGYLADGKGEEEISADVANYIDGDIDKLMSNITAFLDDDSLSLPFKRVSLAQLLGEDDELMTGDMFNPEQLLFRDTYADCIGMFVNANNLLNKKNPDNLYVDIPASDGIPHKEYPETLKKYAALGDEEIHFEQLSREMKSEEVKIRRQTEYIRTLEKDLNDCKAQKRQSEEKTKVLTKDGFRIGDRIYKYEKIESIPLEKTYAPKNGNLPSSVDLRKNFTSVKDQGNVGSCTTFSLASIYEYILGKEGHEADLSERYLYYNTRVEELKRTGHPDGEIVEKGTSFYDAIASLQSDGICDESLCVYSDGSVINEKPSEEAYEDGRKRLVTEAMNVEIKEQDIKSALNEGYPVAVVLRIFDSFGVQNQGFIPLPGADEIEQANEDGIENNHTMVICGYSDEDKVFVVRNSWGVDFGEKGYCYMPYSYITDPELTFQACIITGTSVVAAEKVKDGGVSHEVVFFDKLNPEINAAIINVLIGEARREKMALIKHRMELYSDYSLIEKRIVNSDTRFKIKEGTSERLKWEIGEIQKQKTENEDCENKRIDALDRQNRKTNISFFLSILVIIILWAFLSKNFVYRIILAVIPMTKLFFALLGIGVVAMVIWWISYLKERKKVHEEHSAIAEDLEKKEFARKRGTGDNLGLYTKALSIRMYIAGLVVTKLTKKNNELVSKLQAMYNYTSNLREWYDTEKTKTGTMSADTHEPFISLLSNETLDRYYVKHSDEITKDIRLASIFKEGYSIDEDEIVKFQTSLKNKIIAVLENSLKNFSVYKYITGQTEFEFAKSRDFDVHELLSRLEEKAAVFVRVGTSPVTDETINSTTTVLMSSDISHDLTTWNNEFKNDFSVSANVSHIEIMSPFKLSFLQMKRFPIEECCDFVDSSISGVEKTDN